MSRRTLVLCGCLLTAVVSTRWVRLNVSPSVPYGLYLLRPVPAPLARGMLVVLPVPVSVRPWHSRWLPVLKPVAGIPGDVICAVDDILDVNDADFGPILREAHGQPLPHFTGCLVVQDDEVFLASAVPQSLDSRYDGPVTVEALTAHALPLWTWR
jgi:type IV secretory pathway protease TraF